MGPLTCRAGVARLLGRIASRQSIGRSAGCFGRFRGFAVSVIEVTPVLAAQLLSKIADIAGPHTLTCLTCQTPKNSEQQAISQKQVQITFATELANSDVSVYTLMKRLGHESMVTSQRYVTAAGTETRAAAAQNKLYSLLAADDRSVE
jgi:hypothetical protein